MEDLFNLAANLARCHAPIARDNDVITSHEAADKMVKSGALNRQEKEVYKAIKEYLKICPYRSNFTAKDLRIVYMNYYTAQRRLSGLHNHGLIERIQATTPLGKLFNKDGKPVWMRRDGCAVWRLK